MLKFQTGTAATTFAGPAETNCEYSMLMRTVFMKRMVTIPWPKEKVLFFSGFIRLSIRGMRQMSSD
ncbi:MAG: hypothetical protein DSY50_00490 [Desulfobulbus sp.]|nr:MAG: hypothetical protein DSY50_00490 [Desulfobulbus sp.]RUM38026.1 MAG: hypothetical protein DSY58_02870 [Desulfobulbus sp.]